jgi:flagellar hook assembly protein FlgD
MKISLFNIKGQKVKSWTLSNAKEIIWNGKDESGKTMSDGMYLIKVNNGKETQTNKVLKIDSDSKTTN